MGFTSLEGEVRRRWQRVAQLAIDSEELRSLRIAIALVCEAPQDPTARTRLHGLTADARTCEQLAPLLAAEARLTRDPDVVAVLDDELLRTRARIAHGPPPIETLQAAIAREPENPVHHEQLAWAYYLAGVWPRAAEILEHLASLVPPDEAILPLHAAAKLYRNTGYTERSLTAYRAVVVRKPSNTAALIALGELITEPARTPQPSPFDPSTTEPVEWPALPTVTDPEPEPAGAPVTTAPRTRKRMQVLDRIDDAELEERFASVFDEGESSSERQEAPVASDTVPGPVDDDDGEVLEISGLGEPDEDAGRATVPVLRPPDRASRANPRIDAPGRDLGGDLHAAVTRPIGVLADERAVPPADRTGDPRPAGHDDVGDAHRAVTRQITVEVPPEARPTEARAIAAIRLQPGRATREPSERTRAQEPTGRTVRANDQHDPFADPTMRTPRTEPGRESTSQTPRMREPSELFAKPVRDDFDRSHRLREASDRPPFVQATREVTGRTRRPSDRPASATSAASGPRDQPFAQVAEEPSERAVRRREPSDRLPGAGVRSRCSRPRPASRRRSRSSGSTSSRMRTSSG